MKDNSIKRYVLTKGIINQNEEIIPFWDDRVKYKEYENYNEITLKDDYHYRSHSGYIPCIYDMQTKTFSLGIEINQYPNSVQYPIGSEVLVEVESQHHVLQPDKVKNIIYEDYDVAIVEGYECKSYIPKDQLPKDFNPEALYVIKSWQPTYVFESGDKTKYTFKIYKMLGA